MKRKIIIILQFLYNLIIFKIVRLRGLYWGLFFKKSGKGINIMPHFICLSPMGVEMDDFVSINHHTEISGQGGVKIGKFVLIGPYCSILSSNHEFRYIHKPIQYQEITRNPVIIEDDVWLGRNVTVLPGVTIGRGSIIGAGAVVTKSIPEFVIAGGVPAKVIKNRFPESVKRKARKIEFKPPC